MRFGPNTWKTTRGGVRVTSDLLSSSLPIHASRSRGLDCSDTTNNEGLAGPFGPDKSSRSTFWYRFLYLQDTFANS